MKYSFPSWNITLNEHVNKRFKPRVGWHVEWRATRNTTVISGTCANSRPYFSHAQPDEFLLRLVTTVRVVLFGQSHQQSAVIKTQTLPVCPYQISVACFIIISIFLNPRFSPTITTFSFLTACLGCRSHMKWIGWGLRFVARREKSLESTREAKLSFTRLQRTM